MGAGETGNSLKCKRSVCLTERGKGKNQKSVWWKEEGRAAVRRKEAA